MVNHLADASPSPISMVEGARAIRGHLDNEHKADAVVCVSDLAAFGALIECHREGLLVPGDIAIAACCVPRLTTVDTKAAEIGVETARLVLQLLAAATRPAKPHRVDVAVRLLAGDST